MIYYHVWRYQIEGMFSWNICKGHHCLITELIKAPSNYLYPSGNIFCLSSIIEMGQNNWNQYCFKISISLAKWMKHESLLWLAYKVASLFDILIYISCIWKIWYTLYLLTIYFILYKHARGGGVLTDKWYTGILKGFEVYRWVGYRHIPNAPNLQNWVYFGKLS